MPNKVLQTNTGARDLVGNFRVRESPGVADHGVGQLGNPKLEFVHQSGALSIQAFGVVNQSFNPPRWVNG